MMKYKLPVKIFVIFIFALIFFTGCACASTITSSEVDNTNVYGSTAYYDISASPATSSTATNIVHIADEYIYIESLEVNPVSGNVGDVFTFTPVKRRGAAVYLNGSTIVNGLTMNYDSGGQMSGGNIFTASYTTNGIKNPTLVAKGFNGSSTVTLPTLSTTLRVGSLTLTISKSEAAVNEGVTTSVSMIGGGTLQYHWYARLSTVSQWSDTYFGTTSTNQSATFKAPQGGTYLIKVVVTGSFGRIDSYEDEQIRDFKCIVYSPPTVPTILIDGQNSKTVVNSSVENVTLNIPNYSPVEGDTYSYDWKYSKDGGSRISITTSTSPSIPFDISSLTSGIYDITVDITGKGGTITSNASKLYMVSVSGLAVSENIIGVGDAVSPTIQVLGVTPQYHWYARLGNGQWSDSYFGTTATSQNAVFRVNSSGVYEFKVVLSGEFSSIDSYNIGLTGVKCNVCYVPVIESISISREADNHTSVPYSVRVGVDAHASVSSYSWLYSTDNGAHWTQFSTTASGNKVFDAGVYQIKVKAETNEGYEIESSVLPLNIISITMSTSSEGVAVGTPVTFNITTSNFIAGKTYECMLQVSTDNINWENVGSSSVASASFEKVYSFPRIGNYYVRLHAWDNGEFDYYNYDNIQIGVFSPPTIEISIDKTYGESGEEVNLTAVIDAHSSTDISYQWCYSVDNGSTWVETHYENLTYTVIPSGSLLTLFKVTASTPVYTGISSNIVGYIVDTDLRPITSPSTIGSSSSDSYLVPLKTEFPHEIVDVYALSGGIGLVITQHAMYLIDGNIKEGTENVLAILPISYGKLKSCKYYNSHVIYETVDGRIVVQNIVGTSNFGASMEILGFKGDVVSYDLSQANYMVACENDNGGEIYTYDVTGTLQWVIKDDDSTAFALTKISSDFNLEYVILAGSSNSRILTAYTGASTKQTVELPSNIVSIHTITYDVPKILIVTTDSTLIYDYSLRIDSSGANNFVFERYTTIPYKLSSISSSRNGSLFGGVVSNTFYIIDSNGTVVGTYPTSGLLTHTDLAKLTLNYAVTGGNSGQISILQNSGSWEGLQSFPMPSKTRALSMSDSGTIFFAATADLVYNGIQKASSDDRETVLTTTYYLKISVYDGNGNSMPNASVRVVSMSGTNTYTTDSSGTVTIEVIPTRTYTVSLAGGEDSKIYVADNYALQHLDLRYPKVVITDNIVINAYQTENKYINFRFKNVGNSNLYNLNLKILDSRKNLLLEENKTTNNYENTWTASFLSIDEHEFIIKVYAVPISGDASLTIDKSYIVDITKVSDSGMTMIGNIPLLPDSMDEKWKTLIFGALIMIIAGLFSYQHSIRGCVLMAIIAAVMTFLGLLPISPVWIGCMVVLAFLTLYAWASQNEA